jgi:hypothetical protein
MCEVRVMATREILPGDQYNKSLCLLTSSWNIDKQHTILDDGREGTRVVHGTGEVGRDILCLDELACGQVKRGAMNWAFNDFLVDRTLQQVTARVRAITFDRVVLIIHHEHGDVDAIDGDPQSSTFRKCLEIGNKFKCQVIPPAIITC